MRKGGKINKKRPGLASQWFYLHAAGLNHDGLPI